MLDASGPDPRQVEPRSIKIPIHMTEEDVAQHVEQHLAEAFFWVWLLGACPT